MDGDENEAPSVHGYVPTEGIVMVSAVVMPIMLQVPSRTERSHINSVCYHILMPKDKTTTVDVLIEALRGCDVLVSGSTIDGTPFKERSLHNVSVTRTRFGDQLLSGVDPERGSDGGKGIRSFRLDHLTDLRIVSGPMKGAQVTRDDAGEGWRPVHGALHGQQDDGLEGRS